MQVKDVLKKIAVENPRQKLTLLASVFIVYVVMLSGIFSYFHSEDTATNRLNSKSGAVSLYEPKWDGVGQKKAQTSEPGMTIEKDPYAFNSGQVSEYIRLKMTVKLEGFVPRTESSGDINKTYNEAFNDNTGSTVIGTDGVDINSRRKRRLNGILSAIKTGTGDAAKALFTWNEQTQEITGCNNDKYDMEQGDTNDDCTEWVFYFYYTNGNPGSMQEVLPSGSTERLFDSLEIPVYKADYLGVFDQGYSITMEAEAVPVSGCTDGNAIQKVKAYF